MRIQSQTFVHKTFYLYCMFVMDVSENTISSQKETKQALKMSLTNLFKTCLDILRTEHIVGDKALRHMSYLLVLRLIEPKIGTEINFGAHEYQHDLDDESFEQILKYTKFSNLAETNEGNLSMIFKYLWSAILSQHPKTKDIFQKEGGFEIKHQRTYKKLVDLIFGFNFETIEEDIQGEAYEEVIQDVMTGKILGQFFTPPIIKNIMVDLVDPKLFDDGTCETIYDPAMGTGGFLISCIRHLIKQSNGNNTQLNWDFIVKGGLGGREAEPDTYKLAKSNMLISTGHILDGLEIGDSIRSPINKKVDIVLANPPFGIKGLSHDDIMHQYKDEVLPIKTDSAVPLFLQVIISILKVGGRCAVVLPNGKELFNKTDKSLKAVREYLMKTCEVKEIISMPSNLFNNTSIKTVICYFEKKREGTEVVKTNVSYSNSQKENGRNYTFVPEHQTTTVKFYDYKQETKEKVLTAEAYIESISENDYCLNFVDYSAYLSHEYVAEKNIINYKTLALQDVCIFKNGKQLSKEKIQTGQFPVIGGGKKPVGYHNEYNRNENTILCASSGSAGYISKYPTKIWASDCFSIHSENTEILEEKYLFYFLRFKQDVIYGLQTGAAQPHVYSKDIATFSITVPPIEVQQEISKKLDFIYEECIATSEKKIQQLKQLNELYLKTQLKLSDCEIVELGDVCTINNGKRIVKDRCNEGIYPVYGGGNKTFTTDCYNREGKTCKISREGMSLHNCVLVINGKYYLNSQAFTVNSSKPDIILDEYIWNYLLVNKQLVYDCGRGAAQLAIDIETFKQITIPLLSLQSQHNIIKYCEDNEALIQKLETEIELNKKLGMELISGVGCKNTNNVPRRIRTTPQNKEIPKQTSTKTDQKSKTGAKTLLQDECKTVGIKFNKTDTIATLKKKLEEHQTKSETSSTSATEITSSSSETDVITPTSPKDATTCNSQKDYAKMSLPDLKKLCKERKIKNFSKLKKQEIIELLEGTNTMVINENDVKDTLPANVTVPQNSPQITKINKLYPVQIPPRISNPSPNGSIANDEPKNVTKVTSPNTQHLSMLIPQIPKLNH